MMTARSPGAFMLSATFHAAIVGAILLWAMISDQREKITPRVLELVAGEGDNYTAAVAPKLGTPGGLKIDIPTPPTPKLMPEPEPEPEPLPQPKMITPEPVVTPAPKPPPVIPTPKAAPVKQPAPKAVEKKQPTMKQKILYSAWAAEAKAKEAVKKQRAEEAKRAREAEARAKAAKAGKRIDTEGIAKGVVGGSTANKVGGAGGKALIATPGAVTDQYFALLKQKVQNALDKPPGVSDELEVTVTVQISSNGRLYGARVIKSSGSDEFDRAVIAAFGRVSMPEHPERKNETLELTFRTKDVGER